MKKVILTLLALCLITFCFVSCSLMGAVTGALETKYDPYVLDDSTDIYGRHIKEAILVDKQTVGMADADFTTRIIRNTLDGKLDNYGLQLREHDYGMLAQKYYLLLVNPLIKVDGKIYDFKMPEDVNYTYIGGSANWLDYEIRFKEYEVELSSECVEALKNAKEVYVQFYSYNNNDIAIKFTDEGLQATKDFLNGAQAEELKNN